MKMPPFGRFHFHIMTQVGQNWNELLEELVGWQLLGKDVLAAETARDEELIAVA